MTAFEKHLDKYFSHNPYGRSVDALHRMRIKIFDYPPEKQKQASRVLRYLVTRALRARSIERTLKRQETAYTTAERDFATQERGSLRRKTPSKRARKGIVGKVIGLLTRAR